MAFAIRNLSVLAYAQGFTLWHYKAGAAPLSAAASPGFFDAASEMLTGGDMVMISGADGGRMVCVAGVRPHVVTAAMA